MAGRTATIKTIIDLDKSKFEAGLRAAGNSAKKFAKVGVAAAVAGVAALTAGMVKLSQVSIRGMIDVANLGSRLDDLAESTGATVSELAVLERAFKDAGLSAEKAGPTIAKMLKSVFEGTEAGGGLSTQKRIFDLLDLDPNKLMGMGATQQFKIITEAMRGLGTEAERTGAAMQIFGRTGREMLKIDAGGLERARDAVGDLASLLENNAADFDKIADITGSAFGEAKSEFFGGMLESLKDKILPALKEFDSKSFAQAGRDFATGLEKAVGFMRELKIMMDESAKPGGFLWLLKGATQIDDAVVKHGQYVQARAESRRAAEDLAKAQAEYDRRKAAHDASGGNAPHVPEWVNALMKHKESLDKNTSAIENSGGGSGPMLQHN